MNNKWQQNGSNYYIGDITNQKDKLDNAIYSLEQDPRSGALFLTKLYDNFEFDYKMYGIQDKFITRVINTFNSTKGNLGILLNGIKGTGKSVTAKVLANELNIPIVLVNKDFNGIPDFLNQIQQEIVVFCDEFEKVFNEKDGSILTIMDGVLDNGYRRVFLLTTNQMRINENLIQRPGRLRYLKHFGDLDKETIELIVNDCLIYPEHNEDTIQFISRLELITVDIVKAVVSEVNIHNESPEEFKDVFNVKERPDKYILYQIKDDGDEKIINASISSYVYEDLFRNSNPRYSSYLFGIGDVILDKIINEEELLFQVKQEYLDQDEVAKTAILKLSKAPSYHSSFVF